MTSQAIQKIPTPVRADSDTPAPYISSSQRLPEITLKSFILSILLSAAMAGANAYLGLKIGLTVSATIPAAVISMAILRFFKNANILENNIVQTTASAGEVVAAGTMFTLPALVLMGYWDTFPMWQTSLIVGIGGVFGVLFSIPLRRALVVEGNLLFPEGVATAEVLKVGESSTSEGAKDLLLGGLGATLLKFGQSGIVAFSESIGIWTKTGGTLIGGSIGLSPVLLGAGYIVGHPVGISMTIGGVVAWFIALPLFGYIEGIPEASSVMGSAMIIWSSKIRMIGVGMMVLGGLWTTVHLIDPMRRAIVSSLSSLKKSASGAKVRILRTEQDIPFIYVLWSIMALCLPLILMTHNLFDPQSLSFTSLGYAGVIMAIIIATLVLGFLVSAIAGYMSGILGSSNNPLSGVTIMAVMFVSLLLLVLMSNDLGQAISAATLAGISIIIAAVVACAGAVSCDNLQDLKAGQLVGATPWKQQVMLIVGVIVGSLLMAPIFNVLFAAYGIGDVMPREGMDPARALGAPKAAMMAMVAKGVFTHSLDWSMVTIGGIAAILVIAVDEVLRARGSEFRLPVLAVALGVYMPLEITLPVLIGGLISLYATKKLDKARGILGIHFHNVVEVARRRGMLFASGLVAGEALIGITIAAMIVSVPSMRDSQEMLNLSVFAQNIGGTVVFALMCAYLYTISSRTSRSL